MKKSKSDAYFSRAASNIENIEANEVAENSESNFLGQSANSNIDTVLYQPNMYSENLITDMQRRINLKNDLIEKFKTNKRFNPNKLLSTFYSILFLIGLNVITGSNLYSQDSIIPDSLIGIRNEVEKLNITGFRDCRKVLAIVPFKSPEFRNDVIFDCNRISIDDSGIAVANPKHDFKIFELGFKFMPTFSSFKLETTSSGVLKSEVTPGFGIGTMMAINFTRHAGFQGELIYSALSQKYKDQNLEKEIKVRYINIPLLLSLNTNKAKAININVVFGPQIGINLGSSFKTSSGGAATDTLSYVFAVKPSDLGFAYGAGFEFALDTKSAIRMDMGYRGVRGLMNINNTIAENNSQTVLNKAFVKTSSIYMGLTILF